MLRIGGTKACRCTSTSTSLPCIHAANQRSYSRKTAPNSAPSPSPNSSPSSSTLDYPYHQAERWFEPVQLNRRSSWKDWFDRSSPSTSSTPLAPPPAPLSRPQGDQTTTLLNAYLTTRGPRSTLNQFSDEYGQLLELANRDDLQFLKAMVLEDLEYKGMGSRERGRLGLERFEKKKKNHRVEPDQGHEGEIVEAKGLMELASASDDSVTITSQLGKNRRTSSMTTIKQEEEELVGTRDLTLSRAVSILTQTSDPTIPHVDGDSSNLSPARLSEAWDLFSTAADLEDSIEDFTLTLSFLHYLVVASYKSSSASSSEPLLPLALKVFGTLVRVLPEELIASPPTLVSFSSSSSVPQTIPSDLSLRFILLRTLVNAALSENLFHLASISLSSLSKLDLDLNLDLDLDLDLSIVSTTTRQTIKGWLKELKTERKSSYKPSDLQSSKRGSHLDRIDQLFEFAHRQEARGRGEGGWLEEEVKDSFVEECAERYRWDLVARNFSRWNHAADSTTTTTTASQRGGGGGRVYELKGYHLKFARWLAGLGPYSTYSSTAAATERIGQPRLFSLLARTTHSQLRRTSSNLSPTTTTTRMDWSTSEKYDWIDLLATCPASTRETRSLARRITSYWMQQSTSSSSSPSPPFVLRSSTLLNLIRTSLTPHTPSLSSSSSSSSSSSTSTSEQQPEQRHVDFLRSLVNSTIQSLISPNSPYSSSVSTASGGGGGGSSTPILNHFDLTSLAQAYGLLKDEESVGQVFRKLLDQAKFLPDRKDVDFILSSFSSSSSSSSASPGPPSSSSSSSSSSAAARFESLNRVREAHKVGILVGDKVLRGLIKGVLDKEVERRRRRTNKNKSHVVVVKGKRGTDELLEEEEEGKERRGEEEEEAWKLSIEEILEFARDELEFDRSRIVKLEDFVLGFIPLIDPSRLSRLSDQRLLDVLLEKSITSSPEAEERDAGGPTTTTRRRTKTISTKVALGMIRKASSTRDFRLVSRVYLVSLSHYTSSSSSSFSPSLLAPILDSTLDSFLSCYPQTRPSTKSRILEYLTTVIDSTISACPCPSSLERLLFSPSASSSSASSSGSIIELVLKSLIKIGQIDPIEKLWEILPAAAEGGGGGGGGGVEVRKEVKEMVVRWASGVEGRDLVRERKGIVGVWARQVLSDKKPQKKRKED